MWTSVNIKTNKQIILESVEEEMRVCLLTIRLRIKGLYKGKQPQVSH